MKGRLGISAHIEFRRVDKYSKEYLRNKARKIRACRKCKHNDGGWCKKECKWCYSIVYCRVGN